MSRKARDKEPELPPIASGYVDVALLGAAILTVALVALWFKLDVNRVFDVPKALALKVGGGGVFLVWLLYGLFGRGFRWGSIKLFVGPVFALTAAIIISTLFSIDPATSIYGVYERQFGLQGFLGCIGLFVVTATCFSSRRGAVLGLGVLAIVGGIVGIYAALQAHGIDPYGFFDKPHTKVYSTLGNATFAGNALALIAPISTLLAITGATTTVAKKRWGASPIAGLILFAIGFAAVLGLCLGLGAVAGASQTLAPDDKQRLFKIGVGMALALIVGCAAAGTWGVEGIRLKEEKSRYAADALAAGGIAAMLVGIFLGLAFTRTRGAWVGTGVAITAGFILLPRLFNDAPERKRIIQITCYSVLAVSVLSLSLFVAFSDHLYAKTIRSIPAAFDPDRIDYGKGQGTRRFLWSESPRVLYHHGETLQRLYEDHDDYAEHVLPMVLSDVDGITVKEKLTESQKRFDSAWRKIEVWFFGIGIETYRYAFMSHKSKRLEAMDPMTNHDNPHNNYLYVLASFGIVGLAAYLWLLWRLLSQSFRRFLAKPRRLLGKTEAGEPSAGVITAWEIVEDPEKPRLFLSTPASKDVADLIGESDKALRASSEPGRVIVTGFDPAGNVLERIGALELPAAYTRTERALAFGVVTSFFSYAFYSIAGFDSVACSVFFYFLLGCAAVFFEPCTDEAPRPLGVNIARHWAEFRKREPGSVSNEVPMVLSVVLALIGVVLLGHTIHGGLEVNSAEQAFVGERIRAHSAMEQLDRKISNIKRAISINPNESFYKQNLGNAYADTARYLRSEAAQLQRQGQTQAAQERLAKAEKYDAKAEVALYAALDHAWAPENIFISAFQVYYQERRVDEAEHALIRALEHSPHLGAVRANLAILELERGGYDEAIKDCKWVLEVDKRSSTAWRTCGRAYFMKGDLVKAEKYLKHAQLLQKNDPALKEYLKELADKKKTSTTS